MSDLTVYAEALISTVARAFYDDDSVCLIDVLIRDKFLRDDDMAPRLHLSAKRLRATLQFLTEEHLVRSETVDDLAQGGSQATKFYYLDYNRAVYSIMLRLHLLRKKLDRDEREARSSSFYLCPGYKTRRCNGRYTEEQAQQVVDHESGLFLCQQCSIDFENNPSAPPIKEYTLELVDNRTALKLAVDNLRRVTVQLSSKSIGNHQVRAGIYDLVQKVRPQGKAVANRQPITSNLPSENFALGIGSKRLAGTGRTAGIKAKKLEAKGVAENSAMAQEYLVGSAGRQNDGDMLFLKNAMGQEIQFSVERGGGARALLLATAKQSRRKLMDAAASRVGTSIPLHIEVEQDKKRKREEKEKEEAQSKRKKIAAPLEFLEDNIGRLGELTPSDTPVKVTQDDPSSDGEEEPTLVLTDETDFLQNLPREQRLLTFQAQYKVEMDRQATLLQLENSDPSASSPLRDEDEINSVAWEDGGAP